MRERSRRGRNRAFLCIEQLRESENSRSRMEIMGKSTWFKEGKKNSQWNNATGPLPRPGKRKKIEGRGTQEQISHLCGTHPWGGTSKTNQEPANKDGGTDGIQDQGGGTSRYSTKGPVQPYQHLEGVACSRQDCTTCTQGEEDLHDCTRRNITYESIYV